jgi:hypothetical protein
MVIFKKSSYLFAIVMLISLLLTSCGAAHHAGCPGQDRPSFKSAYSPSIPTIYKFKVVKSDKKSDDVIWTMAEIS